MGYRFARLLIMLFIRIIAHVRVDGIENVPSSGAYIAAANHVGRLEVPLVFYLLNRDDILLLVAEKYKDNVFFRWFVRALDAIWIDRYQADFGALRATLNRLKQGWVVALAPEGTRSVTGKLEKGRPGTSYLAAKSGVPVVPVAVTGTYDPEVLAHLRRLRRLDITVRIGKPITFPPVKGKSRDEALEAYTDEIMCQIAALLPPEMRGVYADHPRLRELIAQQQAVKRSETAWTGVGGDSSPN
jgi:1-acyl-sn-glycerol-3-phosphate acyltransferase